MEEGIEENSIEKQINEAKQRRRERIGRKDIMEKIKLDIEKQMLGQDIISLVKFINEPTLNTLAFEENSSLMA